MLISATTSIDFLASINVTFLRRNALIFHRYPSNDLLTIILMRTYHYEEIFIILKAIRSLQRPNSLIRYVGNSSQKLIKNCEAFPSVRPSQKRILVVNFCKLDKKLCVIRYVKKIFHRRSPQCISNCAKLMEEYVIGQVFQAQ